MDKYETVFIAISEISKEDIGSLIGRIENIIDKYGKIVDIDKMGKRQLAYELHGYRDGYYVDIKFEGNNQCVADLENFYRMNNQILKFITLRGIEN